MIDKQVHITNTHLCTIQIQQNAHLCLAVSCLKRWACLGYDILAPYQSLFIFHIEYFWVRKVPKKWPKVARKIHNSPVSVFLAGLTSMWNKEILRELTSRILHLSTLDAMKDFLWHIWQCSTPKPTQCWLNWPLTHWSSAWLFLRHGPVTKNFNSTSVFCRTLKLIILMQTHFFSTCSLGL